MCNLDQIFSRASSLITVGYQISHRLHSLLFSCISPRNALVCYEWYFQQKASGRADTGLDIGFAVGDVLLLADTIEELVVAVGHDHMHTNEVVNGTEATGRDVSLWQQFSVSDVPIPPLFDRTKRTLYWTGS